MDHNKYPLLHHFKELKTRLFYVVVFYLLFLMISYYYSEEIYQFLTRPLAANDNLKTHKIIYTSLTEVFFSYLKLAATLAFMLVLPVASHQIYIFLSPGLHNNERILLSLTLLAAPILYWLGVIFCYYLVMPKAWQFFMSFEKQHLGLQDNFLPIVLEAKVSEYLQLIVDITMAFGLAFQLPIVLIILTILNVITAQTLANKRRYAIVVMFIFGGILTPPDVFSQFALAIPLILLYEISIKLCKIVEKKRKSHVRS